MSTTSQPDPSSNTPSVLGAGTSKDPNGKSADVSSSAGAGASSAGAGAS
eukprot:CAMPEP_0205818388 /NCGR_PEP_ID=MMETSP0206-20130828/295_1 /ASSEMBLY_ACC=CAM_ASM_000279 /TAXON_ID=36767 /ORGANISM="Euplotes focardii, Strain TN1" /LENGTH=48 /DNA_ID= /DNA_START= /DNA_END= /DNA_ORIENTATION=